MTEAKPAPSVLARTHAEAEACRELLAQARAQAVALVQAHQDECARAEAEQLSESPCPSGLCSLLLILTSHKAHLAAANQGAAAFTDAVQALLLTLTLAPT